MTLPPFLVRLAVHSGEDIAAAELAPWAAKQVSAALVKLALEGTAEFRQCLPPAIAADYDAQTACDFVWKLARQIVGAQTELPVEAIERIQDAMAVNAPRIPIERAQTV